ncbi:hypothetical protein FQN54_006353 [Arachnomyces sp. PD_36]|nr:hypothetical protein FQN54_006353 [Arachnomyces sp. PD_36]
MANVNANMFGASISGEDPRQRGSTVMVLPLNLIAVIVSHLDNVADLARVCRTCRVLNYMTLPQLYKAVTLTSYEKIRYGRDDRPEGCGSASPFSMGLSALVTRNVAGLIQSLTLKGDWKEEGLQEHAMVGRVPDSSMMLNIAVRAAVDRTNGLQSFSWELNTKMLETVYVGLSQLPKLTSLTIRFPSSRHPRPTTVIPPMPHLYSLKITDIDPLCYPDDISNLLLKSKKIRELKMHWSPRMKQAQEPSVTLHDYFRKCIASKSPLRLKKLALQNMYALHTDEFEVAIDRTVMEEVIMLNSPGAEDDSSMTSFVDNSWPAHSPKEALMLKTLAHDRLSSRYCDFLSTINGLENIYFVNPAPAHGETINTPRPASSPTSSCTSPSADENSSGNPHSLLTPKTSSGGVGASSYPSSPKSPGNSSSLLSESYIAAITTVHGESVRRLLLPSRWKLSSSLIARLVRGCPNLEQLALATEVSSLDTLGLLLPFLRNLVAIRLLIPTTSISNCSIADRTALKIHKPVDAAVLAAISNCSPSSVGARSFAEIVDMDDSIHSEVLSIRLADQDVCSKLKIVGLGWKVWEVGSFYTVPASEAKPDLCPERDPGAESNCQPLANDSPPAPSTSTQTSAQPDIGARSSSLGKRPRDAGAQQQKAPNNKRQLVVDPSSAMQSNIRANMNGDKEKVVWRRRVRRVGWEVLKHWEIWAMDVQEI